MNGTLKEFVNFTIICLVALLIIFFPKTKTLDLLGSEGHIAYISALQQKEDVTTPEKCNCNGTRQLTMPDGHTIPCGCKPCKCKKEEVAPNPPDITEALYFHGTIDPKTGLSWCAPCNLEVVEFNKLKNEGWTGKFKMFEISHTFEDEAVKTYDIKSIPTFLIMKDGKETRRHEGFLNSEDIKMWYRKQGKFK